MLAGIKEEYHVALVHLTTASAAQQCSDGFLAMLLSERRLPDVWSGHGLACFLHVIQHDDSPIRGAPHLADLSIRQCRSKGAVRGRLDHQLHALLHHVHGHGAVLGDLVLIVQLLSNSLIMAKSNSSPSSGEDVRMCSGTSSAAPSVDGAGAVPGNSACPDAFFSDSSCWSMSWPLYQSLIALALKQSFTNSSRPP